MSSSDGRATGAAEAAAPPLDFIREIVAADVAAGVNGGRVVTRFPPEPNGYLHIGHAKAICLDFGVAAEHGGRCNLRFDDTNPVKEDVEYVDSIKEDVRWLGFNWDDREYYASDYYERLYHDAEHLIRPRPGLRRLALGRRDPGPSRHADRAGHRFAAIDRAAWRRTSTCSAACAPASSPTAPTCCARRSTWRRPTSTCATRCSTASATRRTTAPATPGASTRCTTTRIRCRTPTRASPTRSARWSTRRTGRSTTGWCASARWRTRRGRSSSRAST